MGIVLPQKVDGCLPGYEDNSVVAVGRDFTRPSEGSKQAYVEPTSDSDCPGPVYPTLRLRV